MTVGVEPELGLDVAVGVKLGVKEGVADREGVMLGVGEGGAHAVTRTEPLAPEGLKPAAK